MILYLVESLDKYVAIKIIIGTAVMISELTYANAFRSSGVLNVMISTAAIIFMVK